MFLILHVLIFSFHFHSLYTVVDGNTTRVKGKLYAVIIDAGSTGTRVSVYEFCIKKPDGPLVLANELFIGISPGLDHYYLEPQKGVESIVYLLKEAQKNIPEKCWPSTPLVLKGTAGFRLLRPIDAEHLLQAVRKVFSSFGFLVNEDAVEIMDGADEGIYSWFAINILLGRVNSIRLGRDTVAVLELGGASTQVAFAVNDSHPKHSMAKFIQTVTAPCAKLDVFATSYLNLGLNAVRHSVFISGKTIDRIRYISECVNPIVVSAEFTYATNTYYLSGKNHSKTFNGNPVVRFDVCTKLIKQKTMDLVNPKPITLKNHQIVAFGSFFSRANQNGLVPESGGVVTVGRFMKKAKEVCATANVDQPFMCLDLAYISILLTDGYGLDATTKIELYKKIDDHEVSWTLGYAHNLLAGISRKKKPFVN